jgi:2-polyprenyl-6-methoxyphenol hydroxylase-like FAD-dependent oxidoreductase
LQIGEDRLVIGHFEHLPVHCKFIALMPQWDFLNFLADHGKRYPTFDLRMQTEAVDLIEENGRVVGVHARTTQGAVEIHADLIVGCDGRHSTMRARAGLESDDYGAPMDVMWFRLSRKPDDSAETFGHIEDGRMMVMLNRTDYWQCAYVIPKGTADEVKRAGLDKFRKTVAEMSPFVSDRVSEIESWDLVKLLTVAVDRLRRWYRPGLLCIGDAAHAMSPIGGVGINLAVQDAVAAANILAEPLRRRVVTIENLRDVQRRREFPTRLTQRLQILVQNNIIGPALRGRRPKAPLFMKMLQWPLLRRIPGRLLALGIRPEHIRIPQVAPATRAPER